MDNIGEKLVSAVKKDLIPSLGVTEPGAIAFASAAAARAVGGKVKKVSVGLSSCIYKNSFTCAVPGTGGMGCALAAALGAVAGDPSKKLTAVGGAPESDIAEAKRLVSEGLAEAELKCVSPEVYIEARVTTENGEALAVVSGRHDRLTRLEVNGAEVPFDRPSDEAEEKSAFRVSSASFDEILDCVENAAELDFIEEAVRMNLSLCERGRAEGLIPLTSARVGGAVSAEGRAELLTCGAIEARVRGASAPAMAITGSGSHGILCSLPVHAAAVFGKAPAEAEMRALLLSMLITMFIKENSGLLSAACGCVLAGGTGAALGLTYLYSPGVSRGELRSRLTNALNSMAASVTGMICHGGNTGCSLKASVGVRAAFAAAEMAAAGFGAESVHGILGKTPEETMRNMGRIAKDMLPVENTILDILSCKSKEKLI